MIFSHFKLYWVFIIFIGILTVVSFRAYFIIRIDTKPNIFLNIAELASHYPDAVQHLSSAVQIQTVSEKNYFHSKSFMQFQQFIYKSYPMINSCLTKKNFGNGTLLYEWHGSNPNRPAIILMAHYDVVPVEKTKESKWEQKPFSGIVKDGYIWGRGAIDDKFNVVAILEAVNYLLKKGYQPVSTIYLIFGSDEETGGVHGNAIVAKYFYDKKINVSYVLDEGLPITQGIIPGVTSPVATVGVAEKGYLSAWQLHSN